jgi:hypothetical protein
MLSVLFFAFEIMGWFFVYALTVYVITEGAMVGKVGVLMMFLASVFSTLGLMVAVLKWGV